MHRARTLLVETIPATRVVWADVIVYRIGKGLVAHRVVSRRNMEGKTVWLTKGDGTWTPDRLFVTADQLVGVVRGIRLDNGCKDTGARWMGYAHAVIGWLGLWIWRPYRIQIDARK